MKHVQFLPLVTLLAACSQGEVDEARTVSGRLTLANYATDNAAVLAQDESGAVIQASVLDTGEFTFNLRIDHAYRLLLANRRVGGTYAVTSRILWPVGSGMWAKLSSGPTVDLGTIAPLSNCDVAPAGIGLKKNGSDDDSPEATETPESESSSSSETSPSTKACEEDRVSGEADLPYDAKIPLGAKYKLADSFLEKGALPKEVIKVELEGGWRLKELQTGAEFVVTQADCDHEGNKAKARDRAFVTWRNADGSIETDHIDMRYCVGSVAPSQLARGSAKVASSSKEDCESKETKVCGESKKKSVCLGHGVKAIVDVGGDDGKVDKECGAGEGASSSSGSSGSASSGSGSSGSGSSGSGSSGSGSSGSGSSGSEDDDGSSSNDAGVPGSGGAAPAPAPSGQGTQDGVCSSPSNVVITDIGVTTSGGSTPIGGECEVNSECVAGAKCIAFSCQ